MARQIRLVNSLFTHKRDTFCDSFAPVLGRAGDVGSRDGCCRRSQSVPQNRKKEDDMTIKTALIAVAALAAALPAAASAERPDRPERPRGDITKEDALSRATERFNEADANGDGYLSLEELTKEGDDRRARHAERMFESQDENDDGFISLDEVTTHAEERFDMVDADGDGVITDEERKAARKEMRKRFKDQRG